MQPFDRAWQVLKENSPYDHEKLLAALKEGHEENAIQRRNRQLDILNVAMRHGPLETLVGHLPLEQQVQKINTLTEPFVAQRAQREQEQERANVLQERVKALPPAQQALMARQMELGYIDEFGNPLQ